MSATDQCEAVVGPHQLLHAILFQHHHSSQRRALGTGAVLAVHHVALLGAVLAGDEQQVEHLHLRTQYRACGSLAHVQCVAVNSHVIPARLLLIKRKPSSVVVVLYNLAPNLKIYFFFLYVLYVFHHGLPIDFCPTLAITWACSHFVEANPLYNTLFFNVFV